MTPFYQDDHFTLWGGDCREVLAAMPAESVHCVVTSPPYWGLRDYGTATWDGGDAACDHKPDFVPRSERPRSSTANIAKGGAYNDKQDEGARAYRDTCRKCGARRIDSQLGLEPTPEEYVANMVAVFREVRRVLRADGTLWLNLGDSYAHDTVGSGGVGSKKIATKGTANFQAFEPRRVDHGLKPKDLVGIPWRVAFALQADGWYLRSDTIWAKPNPMPESVRDRPTKAHEYLFLLSKSPRYYYDADAVREPLADANAQRTTNHYDTNGRGPRDGGNSGLDRLAARMRDGTHAGRNLRSVWTIATEPYPGAHFATFPRKLVEPCVKAGCPEGGTVLDPFAGSGTTLLVAQALGRKGIGIDLNPEYLKQAIVRASRSFGRAAITEQTDKRPDQGLWALDGVPE